ncbi:MAG: hypothetical protein ACI9MC_004167, partial [Kiritimatiellia bacterium]
RPFFVGVLTLPWTQGESAASAAAQASTVKGAVVD